MSDFERLIESLNNTTKNLKSQRFAPPGIFTNAIVTQPNIVELLRDADPHENSFYYIDSNGKPGRRDGSRGIVDRFNDKFEDIEVQNQQGVNGFTGDPNQSLYVEPMPSVIPLPRENVSFVDSEQSKGVKNLLDRFHEEHQNDTEVENLSDTVTKLLSKYPVQGVEEELRRQREGWAKLQHEIKKLENTLELQKKTIASLEADEEVEISEISVESEPPHQLQLGEQEEKTTADLIREEELEIRKLKLELETKKRQSALFE